MNFYLWGLLEGEWVDGKYHLQKLLGSGGFGGVFLAHEVVADDLIDQVAVKLIQVDAGNQNTQLKELKAARKLKHPNLLQGFTCGLTSVKNIPLLYLVMELGEEPLNKRLEKGVLSPESAREVSQDIASALAYLHGEPRKMVHRDLKPANVLLVEGRWQLSDFGLVRGVGSKSATNTTQMLGTPHYAPPESYDGIIAPAWDVWSLGVLLVEALTGKMPFAGDTPQQLQNAVTNAPPQLPSNLPAPFDVIVPGCLEKDRERRLTAVQILDILSSPPPPKTQPVESLRRGYFRLPELALQRMVWRLGWGGINNVIPLNHELVIGRWGCGTV